MRILLIAALVSSVAVAGCRGGDKNTSANNSASANASAPAGGRSTDARLASAVSQCEQGLKSLPNPPPGFDAAGICNCAIEQAFAGQSDPAAYARTPEGQQALFQAIVSCGPKRQGGAAGGNSAGAAAPGKGDTK